jgi:cell wall-associated NlpC family hydrolase
VQQLGLSLLLDDGGRNVARVLWSLASAALLGVLLVLFVPLVLLAQVLVPPTAHPSSPPALASAPPTVAGSGPPASLAGLAPPLASDSRAVDVARRYLGVPYLFGGLDPARGLDCSGLVQLVFGQLGHALPRTAQQQYDATAHLGREQLQPGDLVFFARTYADPHDWITHVGIYIGGGQQINAPTEGQVVSIQPVFTGFWGDHFVAGGRV